jgi:hypothetical protein
MRWQVAKLIRKTLERMDPQYPDSPASGEHLAQIRKRLKRE